MPKWRQGNDGKWQPEQKPKKAPKVSKTKVLKQRTAERRRKKGK